MRKLIAGLALFVVTAGATPRLQAQVPGPASQSAPTAYASLASARSGVARDMRGDAAAPRPDTSATGTGSARRRAAHAAVGAGAGLLVGVGVGALVGYGLDRNDRSDAMVPAAFTLGAIGAVAGLVIGAVAGALIR